jgi:hypothetical protein
MSSLFQKTTCKNRFLRYINTKTMMKKLFGFVILFVSLYAWGSGNVIMNPGFDACPWDTGWTWDTSSSYRGAPGSSAGASVGVDSGFSLPNCCELRSKASACIDDHQNAHAHARIQQAFDQTVGCVCEVRLKYCLHEHPVLGAAMVQVRLRINERWTKVWSAGGQGTGGYSDWVQICTTIVNDTISGVEFWCNSSAWCGGSTGSGSAAAEFWVDDVFTEELGVEEESNDQLAMSNRQLSILPNPFIRSTVIQYHVPAKTNISLEIYDITGRTVKTLVSEAKEPGIHKVTWSAEGLATGMYFAKLVVDGCGGETKKLIVAR